MGRRGKSNQVLGMTNFPGLCNYYPIQSRLPILGAG